MDWETSLTRPCLLCVSQNPPSLNHRLVRGMLKTGIILPWPLPLPIHRGLQGSTCLLHLTYSRQHIDYRICSNLQPPSLPPPSFDPPNASSPGFIVSWTEKQTENTKIQNTKRRQKTEEKKDGSPRLLSQNPSPQLLSFLSQCQRINTHTLSLSLPLSLSSLFWGISDCPKPMVQDNSTPCPPR